jgi:hypothetical protein
MAPLLVIKANTNISKEHVASIPKVFMLKMEAESTFEMSVPLGVPGDIATH